MLTFILALGGCRSEPTVCGPCGRCEITPFGEIVTGPATIINADTGDEITVAAGEVCIP